MDRGGGREAKGSSLRRSKKNPGAPSTRNKSVNKNFVSPTTRAIPTVPIALMPLMHAMVAYYSEATTNGGSGEQKTLVAHTNEAVLQHVDAVGALVAPSESLPASRHIDAATAILSRKLEVDREYVFRRAGEEGELAAMICWSSEWERQSLLLETCRSHNKLALQQSSSRRDVATADGGTTPTWMRSHNGSASPQMDDVSLYCVVGIHANNVDRMNRKAQEAWLESLRADAKNPEVIGVLSGLNLSRESATHFPQEHLLKECWGVAAEYKLPLVLHLYASEDVLGQTMDRAAELLQELMAVSDEDGRATPRAVVLYNGLKVLASSQSMQELVRSHRPATPYDAVSYHDERDCSDDAVEAAATIRRVPFYILATAEGLAEVPEGVGVVADSRRQRHDYISLLPNGHPTEDPIVSLSQLLIGTGSPWCTPQNIPDVHLCTMPNEPGNYQYVVEAVSTAMQSRAGGTAEPLTAAALGNIVLHNLLWLFFAEAIHHGGQREPADAIGAGACDGVDGNTDTTHGGAAAEGKEVAGLSGETLERRPQHSSPDARHPMLGETPTVAVEADGLMSAPRPAGYSATDDVCGCCALCRSVLFDVAACVTHPPKAATGTGLPPSAKAAKGNRGEKRRGNNGGDEHVGCDEAGCAGVHVLRVAVDRAALAHLETVLGYVDPEETLLHLKGVQGGCTAVHAGRDAGRGIRLQGPNAMCAQCGAKLGVVRVDGPCACGATLPGVTLRLQANRVELNSCAGTVESAGGVPLRKAAAHRHADPAAPAEAEDELDTLLAAAALERERLAEEREAAEMEAQAQAAHESARKKAQREKKKNVKANNRSNFTHFRNKDFAPPQGKGHARGTQNE